MSSSVPRLLRSVGIVLFLLAGIARGETSWWTAALSVREDIGKGLWIHRPEEILFHTGTAREELFECCETPIGSLSGHALYSRMPVSRLLLPARLFVTSGREEADSLRSFLREAHRRCLRVDFLDGEPRWINAGWGDAMTVLRQLVDFQRGGAAEERFDGVVLHLNVQTLRQWTMPNLWNQYVRFMTAAGEVVRASGIPMSYAATIPHWFCQTPGRDSLSAVMRLLDEAILLSRVSNRDDLVCAMVDPIALADSLRVRAVVNVEVSRDVLPHMSLFDGGVLQLDSAFEALHAAFVLHPEYSGVAVDDYDALLAMRRSRHALGGIAADSALPEISTESRAICTVPIPHSFFSSPVPRGKRPPVQSRARGEIELGEFPAREIVMVERGVLQRGSPLSDSRNTSIVPREANTIRDIAARLSRAPFDGLVIDILDVERTIAPKRGSQQLAELVRALTGFARVYRRLDARPDAPIVIRCTKRFVDELEGDLREELASYVDGVLHEEGEAPKAAPRGIVD